MKILENSLVMEPVILCLDTDVEGVGYMCSENDCKVVFDGMEALTSHRAVHEVRDLISMPIVDTGSTSSSAEPMVPSRHVK